MSATDARTTPPTGPAPVAAPPAPGPARRLLRAAAARPGLLVALVLAVLFALAAAAPGLLSRTDPQALDLGNTLAAPGAGHPFGTDEQGRDLYSRVVHGTRLSLGIGLGAAGLSLVLATVLGSLSALGPRPVRAVVSRIIEIQFAFPTLLLALLLVAITGPSATTQLVAVAIGTAPGYARMIRAQILQAKGSAYVEAALALGHPHTAIVRRHVLPNAVRPLVVVFALSIGQSIVWASSLAFLGLGVAPPSPEWGALLDAGRLYLVHAPWLTVIPGLVIVVLAVVATTIGNHLRLALEKGEQ